jgi:hypothetical protein
LLKGVQTLPELCQFPDKLIAIFFFVSHKDA